MGLASEARSSEERSPVFARKIGAPPRVSTIANRAASASNAVSPNCRKAPTTPIEDTDRVPLFVPHSILPGDGAARLRPGRDEGARRGRADVREMALAPGDHFPEDRDQLGALRSQQVLVTRRVRLVSRFSDEPGFFQP